MDQATCAFWDLCCARGLSIKDLARQVSVSRGTVYAWVHGQTYPRLDTLRPLARALDLTVDELIDVFLEGPIC